MAITIFLQKSWQEWPLESYAGWYYLLQKYVIPSHPLPVLVTWLPYYLAYPTFLYRIENHSYIIVIIRLTWKNYTWIPPRYHGPHLGHPRVTVARLAGDCNHINTRTHDEPAGRAQSEWFLLRPHLEKFCYISWDACTRAPFDSWHGRERIVHWCSAGRVVLKWCWWCFFEVRYKKWFPSCRVTRPKYHSSKKTLLGDIRGLWLSMAGTIFIIMMVSIVNKRYFAYICSRPIM
jgi:hypothetical protein